MTTPHDEEPPYHVHRPIIPHTGCRYAVVFARALRPDATGYAVVAVHAIDTLEGCTFASAVSRPETALAYGKPAWIERPMVLHYCANSKEAYGLASFLHRQDLDLDGTP